MMLVVCASLAWAAEESVLGRVRGTLGFFAQGHPQVIYSVETEEPLVALTIDDAPDAVSTRRILEVLAENDARATFFLIAERIPGNEALIEEMLAAGHEIGNHMTRDESSIKLSPRVFENELLEAHEALTRFARPSWFRPGSGWYNDNMLRILAKHGYRCALGSIYPFDAQIASVWWATEVILWAVDPGDVIILHDGGQRGERTAETLAAVLPRLRKLGYRVVNLTDLVAANVDKS